MRRYTLAAILAALAVVYGCENELPTATSEELIPVEARTAEVRIPFEEITENLQVIGGFGSAADLGYGLVARSFQDTLDARTLVRFHSFPVSAEVEDTTGTIQEDSTLTFVGGRVIARFDTTVAGSRTIPADVGPPLMRASATTEPWDPRSASWDLAVDTVGNQRPWPEPGGGPVLPLDTARWNPEEADSVIFRVDSATVASWADTTNATRGLRLELETANLRYRLRNVSLLVEARPSVNPDTTVFVRARQRQITFLYTPFPEPPPDGLRFGGVPAWRTVFRMALPSMLDGPPEACAALGCPIELTPERVNYAAVVLRTRATPSAFQPTDSLRMDLRPVLRPELLPKSPVGSSLGRSGGTGLAPELFGARAGEIVELPMTTFVRNLIRGETEQGGEVQNTVALLSNREPVSLSFAGFDGPGSETPPVLRLVVTQSDGVTLP